MPTNKSFKFKTIVFLVVFGFFAFFSAIAWFVYSFYNKEPVKTVSPNNESVLVLNGDLINDSVAFQISNVLQPQGFNVTVAYPNSKTVDDFSDYTFVVAYFPNRYYNSLFSSYFSRLKLSKTPVYFIGDNTFAFNSLKLSTDSLNTTTVNDVSKIKDKLISLDESNYSQMLVKSRDIKDYYLLNSSLPVSFSSGAFSYNKRSDTTYTLCNYFYLTFKGNSYSSKYPNLDHTKGNYCYIFDISKGVENSNISKDTNILKDLTDIQSLIKEYALKNSKLPLSLDLIKYLGPVNLEDPTTGSEYVYILVSNNVYQLCAGLNSPISGFVQEESLLCKSINLDKDNIINSQRSSEDFEWGLDVTSNYWLTTGEYIIKKSGDNSFLYLSSSIDNFFIGKTIVVTPGKYVFSVYIKNTDSCKDCAFIGLKLADSTGVNITKDFSSDVCGFYDSQSDSLVSFLVPNLSDSWELREVICVIPENVSSARIVFGYKRKPVVDWSFDNIKLEKK